MSKPEVDPIYRLLRRVHIDQVTGCWNCTLATNGHGYCAIWTCEKQIKVAAHRVSYEFFVGPIPDGMQLDHLCRNRICVNPDHLEPVTNYENNRRGQGNMAKTHCPRGHAYDYIWISPDGRRGRKCRACDALSHRNQRLIKKMIIVPCEDEPAHIEDNGYWCDDPSCPCRQERSYCERYIEVV